MRLATLAAAALVAGSSLSAQTLVPDTGFDSDGSVQAGSAAAIEARGLDTDDKDRVYVSASSSSASNTTQLRRFTPSGTPDASFGSGGYVALDLRRPSTARLTALAQDRGVLVYGRRGSVPSGVVPYALRVGDGGQIDAAFAPDLTGFSTVASASPRGDGFALVGLGDACTLLAVDAAGAPDAGFGTDGRAELLGGDACSDAVVQVDGASRVVVLATRDALGDDGSSDLVMQRFTAGGALDASFGDAGSVVFDFENENDRAASLIIAEDGTLLVAGSTDKGDVTGKLVVRLDADGQRLDGFGFQGLVFLAGPSADAPSFDGTTAAFLNADGSVTVHGTLPTPAGPGDSASTAARLRPDGLLDLSFGADGYDRFRDLGTSIGGPFPERVIVRDTQGRTLLAFTAGRTNTRQVLASRYVESGTVAGDAAPAAALDPRAVPNPAAGRATIAVTLDAPTALTATVHDALGRTVATLADGQTRAGTVSLNLDASALAPAVYLVRVVADGAVQTTRVTVVR